MFPDKENPSAFPSEAFWPKLELPAGDEANPQPDLKPDVLHPEPAAAPEASRYTGGEVTKNCPGCGRVQESGAILCIDCGYDRRVGERRQTVCEPLQQRWDFGWSATTRLLVIGGAAVIFAACLAGWPSPTFRAVVGAKGLAVLLVASGAVVLFGPLWLVGGCSSVVLERDRNGQLSLHGEIRWAFLFPQRQWRVAVRPDDFLVFSYRRECRDGLGRRRYSDVFTLRLVGADGLPRQTVYNGPDEDTMREVADALKECAGLRFERG